MSVDLYWILLGAVRRWRDGVVADLGDAVDGPVRVVEDQATARRLFDVLPAGLNRADCSHADATSGTREGHWSIAHWTSDS